MNIWLDTQMAKLPVLYVTTLSFVTYQAIDTGEDCGGTVQ